MAASHSDALAVFGVTGAYSEDEGTASLRAASVTDVGLRGAPLTDERYSTTDCFTAIATAAGNEK